VGPVELAEYKYNAGTRIVPISFGQLSSTKANSTIIFEDIIYLTPADEKLLRKCLNYDAHHKAQKIFCVTHSVHKTAVWSLLPFFHYLIFSNSPSNKPLIRTCLKTVFKMHDTSVENWLTQFLNLGKGDENKNCYFYFDTKLMTFYYTPDLLNAGFNSRQLSEKSTVPNVMLGSVNSALEQEREKLEIKKNLLENKFEKFTDSFILKNQANAVFSILINCLNLTLVREHDLTISFQSALTKKTKRISLVDYVLTLLDPENKKPNQDLLVLHKYLESFCNIPSLFINNSYFKAFPLKK
jgi:hypothetical protein